MLLHSFLQHSSNSTFSQTQYSFNSFIQHLYDSFKQIHSFKQDSFNTFILSHSNNSFIPSLSENTFILLHSGNTFTLSPSENTFILLHSNNISIQLHSFIPTLNPNQPLFPQDSFKLSLYISNSLSVPFPPLDIKMSLKVSVLFLLFATPVQAIKSMPFLSLAIKIPLQLSLPFLISATPVHSINAIPFFPLAIIILLQLFLLLQSATKALEIPSFSKIAGTKSKT